MLAVGYIRHPKKSYDLSAGETRGPALNYRLRMTSAPGQTQKSERATGQSALPSRTDVASRACQVRKGSVEDGRGSLGHSATLRFPSPLIEPDVPISGIRLSDWLHREVHGEQTNRTRLRHGE